MTLRPTRAIGPAVTLLLLLAFFLYWRGAGPAGGPDAPAPLARGGEIVGSVRGAPRTFNRYVARDLTTDIISMLTQARLVRINRATFELEPWLAESWRADPDGRTYTLTLRPGLEWSDGTPLTSADILFSLRAVFDPKTGSVLAGSLTVAGQPIRGSAPDDRTVVLTYPAPSGPGLRLLDNLPIYPRHKLEAALDAGAFTTAWDSATPPAEMVGAGPFVLADYRPNERIVFDRNPRFWRTAPDGTRLPYLDRIVLEVVPDQNAELLRLQAGATDFTHSELRAEDYVPARRLEAEGRLRVVELGVSPDADALWFCLKPEARRQDRKFAFVARSEFRQALSHAVDREAFAETVFLGAAVPVWGPITPGNRPWFTPGLPRYPYSQARARELLASIGLEDRDGNGVVEDARGTEARFTVITQRGVGAYERALAVIRDELAQVGVAIEAAPLEFGAMIERMLACNYEAIYMRVSASDLDPAGSLDLWLSSGSAHVWNIGQRTPATEWEQRIDTLMLEQAAALDPGRRRALFDDVQRIFAEHLPMLHFAAPRLYYAYSARLAGVVPSVMRPPILWSADTIGVTGPPPAPR